MMYKAKPTSEFIQGRLYNCHVCVSIFIHFVLHKIITFRFAKALHFVLPDLQKMAHEHLYNRGSCAMNREEITHGVAQPHTAVATLAPLIFAGNPRLIAYNLRHLGQTSRRR